MVLKRALDLKAEKEGVGLKASLLYDVGKNIEELRACKKELAGAKEENGQLRARLEEETARRAELEVVRESNNEAFL